MSSFLSSVHQIPFYGEWIVQITAITLLKSGITKEIYKTSGIIQIDNLGAMNYA
jgi:hypothetical protein